MSSGERMTASYLVAQIKSPSEAADAKLAAFMNGPAAGELIGELLSWPDAAVRFWALEAAERALPPDAYVKALKRAAGDSDDEVSADAISRLADVAPDELRRRSRSLITRLGRDVPSGEKVSVLWTLAKIRATDQLPAIEDFRKPLPDWWQLARVADVVLMYLRHGAEPTLRRLLEHRDHARMEELCTLAWHVIHTDAAREALLDALDRSPDEACREKCRFALSKFI